MPRDPNLDPRADDPNPPDVPSHLAPLFAGPVELPPHGDDAALEDALGERLAALLDLYHCDPTPAGWRALALRLALDHEVAGVRVMGLGKLSPAPKKGLGRPTDDRRWFNRFRLNSVKRSMQRKSEKAGGKAPRDVDVANAVAAQMKREVRRARNAVHEVKDAPAVKTLVNLLADAHPEAPAGIARIPLEVRALKALHAAALRLEKSR